MGGVLSLDFLTVSSWYLMDFWSGLTKRIWWTLFSGLRSARSRRKVPSFLVFSEGSLLSWQPGDTGKEWKHINGACPKIFHVFLPSIMVQPNICWRFWVSFVSILWARLPCTSNGRKGGTYFVHQKIKAPATEKPRPRTVWSWTPSHDEKHLLCYLDTLTLWGHGPSQKCPSRGGGVLENAFLLQPISYEVIMMTCDVENLLNFWLRTGGPSP